MDHILVYTGDGSSHKICVSHLMYTLYTYFGGSYGIHGVDAEKIINNPWQKNCALLIFPGGRASPWANSLNGKGNQKIQEYIESGGRYLGFGAGGYYGSKEIEFEKGTPNEICGPRELAFFPGICRGTVFKGFIYGKETGARAAPIQYNRDLFPDLPENSYLYCNGGGFFVDAENSPDVQILAWYTKTDLSTKKTAAIVQVSVGKGMAILTGVHPEIWEPILDHNDPDYHPDVLKNLKESEKARRTFLYKMFHRIGISFNERM